MPIRDYMLDPLEEKPIMVCPDCGGEIYKNDRMYEVNIGYYICEECFKNWVSYMPATDLADKMQISNRRAIEI